MTAHILIGLAALSFTTPPLAAQKIAAPLVGVPVRLGIQPSTTTLTAGQTVKLVVTLLDGEGKPAKAKTDMKCLIVIRPPTGPIETHDETVSTGQSSDTQHFTPRLTGRYVVEVSDKTGRLFANANSFFVFARRKSSFSLPGFPAWLAAKPSPPEPAAGARSAPPKPTLHISYTSSKEGVLADGIDAVEISVVYDDAEGGAAPKDIPVWFRHSNGNIDNRPLVIAKGQIEGRARWTSKYPIKAATIDLVAPKHKYEIEGPQSSAFKFVRQVVRLKPILPPTIPIVDRPEITVHFVDVDGLSVTADRKRTVTFSVPQPGVLVSPATQVIDEGGGPVRATVTPVSLGIAKIQIVSDGLLVESNIEEITVGIGSLVLLSFLGALAGGGLAYLKDKNALALKLIGGLAGGFVLAAIYVFGAVPLSNAAIPSNSISAIVVSIIGGFVGTAVLDWAWGKLSKA